MKIELDKKKFIRNILIGIISLIIVAFILNTSPGYRRDKYVDVINLVLNDTNITENLNNYIYINENGSIYLSKEDISEFFDRNIYYDENYNTIITTSETKTAGIEINTNSIEINNKVTPLLSNVIKINGEIYIPITELKDVYNIEINYIEETNIVIIDELEKGMIEAEVEIETVMKFKPRALSKDIGKVLVGDNVKCFYTTSKGWRLIRTENGILGYVKANVLSDENILRQDTETEIETKEISISLANNSTASIQNDNEKINIMIKNLFTLANENIIQTKEDTYQNETYQIWATISNDLLEEQANKILGDYKNRKELINLIVESLDSTKINAVNIAFEQISNSDNFIRFIIELAPRLRDKQIQTNVVVNDEIETEKLVGIVEYLINEKE